MRSAIPTKKNKEEGKNEKEKRKEEYLLAMNDRGRIVR